MSLSCMITVMDKILVSYPEWAVLFHMSDGADDQGRYCTILRDYVAWNFNLSPEQVDDAVALLVDRGIIEFMVQKGLEEGKYYRINFGKAPRKMTLAEWRAASDEDRKRESAIRGTE